MTEPKKKQSVSSSALTACDASLVARDIRLQSARMIHRAKSSHIGSAFSMADLLAVLYTKTLRIDPNWPDWPERDRFVLSLSLIHI